jgi:hypothetical protein
MFLVWSCVAAQVASRAIRCRDSGIGPWILITQRLGIIGDDGSTANPYSWSIGFAINSTKDTGGVETVGLTCAACHKGELAYRGKTLRVDGGQGTSTSKLSRNRSPTRGLELRGV